LVPIYQADAVLRGADVDADAALALASFGPFGTGNPKPRLLLVDALIQHAETTRNGAHLRCSVEVDGVKIRTIGFGLGEAAATVREDPRGRVLGVQFRVDEWQGTLRPEFLLERIGVNGRAQKALGECTAACRYADPMTPVTHEAPTAPTVLDDGAAPRMPAAHDLRGQGGHASAVAQVLASGERTLILSCSALRARAALGERMPLDALCVGDVACVSRGCLQVDRGRLSTAQVVVLEWEAAPYSLVPLGPFSHLVAVDPPFRRGHVAFLNKAAEFGAIIHLCYGDEERQATLRLLRYLVHPRFAMVCLYRAMQEGDRDQERLFSRAAAIAWAEAHVLLTYDDFALAAVILAELGVERPSPGEAKLEARSISAYALAEADYEECSKLCLSL
jgi:hypothetical protein